jgi:outer membrane protein OmpA-like peptidoglycan-associated protein
MKYQFGRAVAAAIVIVVLSIPGIAQQDPIKKKYTSASFDGATGLFHTWDAETLRRGEFNFSAGLNYTNRDPGRLIMRNVPLSIGVGIFDRFEVFGSFDARKIINAPGVQPYGTSSSQLPQPAKNLAGTTTFNNVAPFMDVPNAAGLGDFRVGAILNAASERRGNPLALSFAAFAKIPSENSNRGMNLGLTNGATEAGFMALFSKRAGRVAVLHLNLGANFVSSPSEGGVLLAHLQNSFVYRGGVAFPTYGKIQFIAEVNGAAYSGTDSAINPKNPVDAVFGFKAYPAEWFSIGGGYQGHFNRLEQDRANGVLKSGVNGFVIQAAFGRRRHDPPKLTCACSPQQIIQDEKSTVRANVVIPEGTAINYSWAATGGKLAGSGDTAVFDASGITPGKYSVTITATDDYKHSVSCTSEITVNKKYLPPTVRTEPPTASIMVGENTTIRAIANSPDGSPLTYSWTVNGQQQAASGTTFDFGAAGRQPGNYTVAVTVNTGKYTATASSTVTVRELPIPAPTIECLTPTAEIESGGTVNLRVRAVAERAVAAVSWSASAGTIAGADQSATFNGTGLSAGTYNVTATVDNGRGGRASCTMTINVSQRINVPGFLESKWRINNVAKAILDNVAVQMKNDPRLHASVAGYIDDGKREKKVKDLGLKRAQAAVDYLVSKGIDASRLTAANGGVGAVGDNKTEPGRKENRRVEIQLGVR